MGREPVRFYKNQWLPEIERHHCINSHLYSKPIHSETTDNSTCLITSFSPNKFVCGDSLFEKGNLERWWAQWPGLACLMSLCVCVCVSLHDSLHVSSLCLVMNRFLFLFMRLFNSLHCVLFLFAVALLSVFPWSRVESMLV